MGVGVVPAPLLGAAVTFVKFDKVAVLGSIVPDAAATTGTVTVQVAKPDAIVPPENVTILPETVAVPPHELVGVTPAGKLIPAGNV